MALESATNHRVHHTCSKQKQHNVTWLWTQPIPGKEARRVFLDITFAQEEQQSAETYPDTKFNVYLLETHPRLSIRRKLVSKLGLAVPPGKHFPPEYLFPEVKLTKIREQLNSVTQMNLGTIPGSPFYLLIEYLGPCLFLGSFRIYFRKCPAGVAGLARYPTMAGGSGVVNGSCVENAKTKDQLKQVCNEDGTWGPLSGQCICDMGFENTETKCEACKIGFFKPLLENAACRKCAPFSHSKVEGSALCQCLDSYYRKESDPWELGCTRPPSAPENATLLLNGSQATLMWDPPTDWGHRHDGNYWISCSSNPQGNSTVLFPCQHLIYTPGQSGLLQNWVYVGPLSPCVEYHFQIEAVNGMSEKGKGAFTTVTVQLRENSCTTTEYMIGQRSSHPAGRQQLTALISSIICGSLLLVLIVAGVIVWHRKQAKLCNSELGVPPMLSSTVTYRRREEDMTLWGLPIQKDLKEKLKDVMVERTKLILGCQLGSGEFGSVYLGILQRMNGPNMQVAVKTMKVGVYTSSEMTLFLHEAALMRDFSHPNVLQLLGISFDHVGGETAPVPMVILPFMKHGDLRSFLLATRHRNIPVHVPMQTQLQFMVDIAAGMDYLARKGFLHRDLAARNCMLQDNLKVCVADFGLSKKMYSSDYYRQAVTARMPVKWMAIESIAESIYSSKTDVWSFGVTMWEIVSQGKTPYPGIQNHEVYDFLQDGHRLKKLPDCPDMLYNVMYSCWLETPNHRPSFSELHRILMDLYSWLAPSTEEVEKNWYMNSGLLQETQETPAAPIQQEIVEEEVDGQAGNPYHMRSQTPSGTANMKLSAEV
ncbi:tyrosine-protein kinase Mer isoform X2 [Microcaecilia unicolor]|nr:tyrosine-protein kinase Mer-like isoform X2 [Microcaecilia unicolor]